MRDGALDECTGPKLGICHVPAAFVDDAVSESAAPAKRVINRWYCGLSR